MGSDGGEPVPTPVADEAGYHVYHDATSPRPLSETLITALAVIRNIDPTVESIPLADAIDPDSLDLLFADTHGGKERSEGYVVFTVVGLEVFAHANGHIFIRERIGSTDTR
ncbi:HalOD1 output domain-containing protein [Haladaptatus salinisoli]|uniref:HalOD1 output domain-containing protein n=1 Tax=Haladaptatus salinisoli TaxID=2884876 RepID=UPI001D0AF23F|nr:HalOD1 output domain-containing protein [Haladaptatus salinisoli]